MSQLITRRRSVSNAAPALSASSAPSVSAPDLRRANPSFCLCATILARRRFVWLIFGRRIFDFARRWSYVAQNDLIDSKSQEGKGFSKNLNPHNCKILRGEVHTLTFALRQSCKGRISLQFAAVVIQLQQQQQPRVLASGEVFFINLEFY
ncbi:hypothetical protein DVH24_009454 [Malus domestica]|uniref:Uncharacterized protein n=1 Tax=Malus domestica TaxID=3750 RepID=A0A498IW39_MALDO|nr:hypothetical protein DVH24_009454 [Malus domestica]